MHFHGDELGPDKVVTVDGRIVQADIRELNTDEGWVDIFFPVMPTEEKMAEVGDVDTATNVPIFDTEIRRLTGKIRIETLGE